MWLGILAIATSWLFSIELFLHFMEGSLHTGFEMSWPWFSAGIYPFEWGILLDGPSIVMLLVVTTVSLLDQVYSLGYVRRAEASVLVLCLPVPFYVLDAGAGVGQ